MLNGAKKTTFDIARISIQEVTFQISNSDNFTSSNFLFHNFRHNVNVFDIFSTSLFYQHPILALPLHSSHTHAVVFQKKNVFFSLFMPRLLSFSSSPPLQARTTYTIFSSPNEILHKLTSCHFILQNKTLNDLRPKILLFSPPRANCTIHQRTVTQTHDLSCHQFSLKSPFLQNFHFIVTLQKKTFFSLKLKTLLSKFHFWNTKIMMSTNERRRETT